LDSCKEVYENCSIDFTEYFEDIIGVTNDLDREPEKVLIELSGSILPYIKSKPMHGSQKIKGNILEINVKLNYELVATLLSFGDQVKVLQPESLVNQIKEKINKLKTFY